MNNKPVVKVGIVAVSRDCFPMALSQRRLDALADACRSAACAVEKVPVIIENEIDALKALEYVAARKINAAVIYLGNFGPEGPLSIFAQKFGGPVMLCGAAEEDANDLIQGRGDAFCGMLNAAYNLALRQVSVHIPEKPVGLPAELADAIRHFQAVAAIYLGVKHLKIFCFGPRPQDFYACNAPLAPLYKLGVEVMENSELDLLNIYQAVKDEKRVAATAAEMAAELGPGNAYPDLLPKMAKLEIALLEFMGKQAGSRAYGIFANKCWPAFEKYFQFVPCYINARLAGKGVPVACEVDIYGALSEYCCMMASDYPATLLDINNTVPAELVKGRSLPPGVDLSDLFMGFHCGNTNSRCLKNHALKFQLIMHRLMEGKDAPPDITRGTLEGSLKPGAATVFRLQSTADGVLRSYVAEGEILDVDPRSFGAIGIFGIAGFSRFYRHVLLERRFPHHAAVAFKKCGGVLYDALRLLGVADIHAPLPKGMPYATENPFVL